MSALAAAPGVGRRFDQHLDRLVLRLLQSYVARAEAPYPEVMPTSFDGLPLHPLIVHATVVVVPLAAMMVGLYVLWPRFRTWAGPLPAAASLVALLLVPLSTSTGETLEKRVEETDLVERHADIAGQLLPWTIGLAVIGVTAYLLHRQIRRGSTVMRPVVFAVAALALVASIGTTVQVALIGHAGAKAAWADTDMGDSGKQSDDSGDDSDRSGESDDDDR